MQLKVNSKQTISLLQSAIRKKADHFHLTMGDVLYVMKDWKSKLSDLGHAVDDNIIPDFEKVFTSSII